MVGVQGSSPAVPWLSSCFGVFDAMAPQVLTGCSREPYDWLDGEDLLVFRKHDSTREVGPMEVWQ